MPTRNRSRYEPFAARHPHLSRCRVAVHRLPLDSWDRGLWNSPTLLVRAANARRVENFIARWTCESSRGSHGAGMIFSDRPSVGLAPSLAAFRLSPSSVPDPVT